MDNYHFKGERGKVLPTLRTRRSGDCVASDVLDLFCGNQREWRAAQDESVNFEVIALL